MTFGGDFFFGRDLDKGPAQVAFHENGSIKEMTYSNRASIFVRDQYDEDGNLVSIAPRASVNKDRASQDIIDEHCEAHKSEALELALKFRDQFRATKSVS